MSLNKSRQFKKQDNDIDAALLERVYEGLQPFEHILSPEKYSKCAQRLVKHHEFLLQQKHTVISTDGEIFNYVDKVNPVVKHFENAGLTYKSYVTACGYMPQLFYLSSSTPISRIESLVANYKDIGFTTEKCIQAANLNPVLYYAAPKTIARHIGYALLMQDKGYIKKNNSDEHTLSDYLAKNAAILSLSDENFLMRLDYACRTGLKEQETFSLLSWRKSKIETLYQEQFDMTFDCKRIYRPLLNDLESRDLLPLPKGNNTGFTPRVL